MKNNDTAPTPTFWGFSGYLQVLPPPEPKREATYSPTTTPQPQLIRDVSKVGNR